MNFEKFRKILYSLGTEILKFDPMEAEKSVKILTYILKSWSDSKFEIHTYSAPNKKTRL